MISKRTVSIIALMALATLTFNACAQWSPMMEAPNLGEFGLLGSSGKAVSGVYAIGMAKAADMTASTAASAVNIAAGNNTNNTTSAAVQPVAQPVVQTATAQPALSSGSGLPVIDLSGYGDARKDKDLTGYTNVMYPLAGARGFTAGTGGSGGGGGCCGG